MFKLPNSPSPQADTHELADFVELLAWDMGIASKREIVAYLGRVDDNDHNEGCDDDDDENSDFLDEVMNEIERRATACGSGYPFQLDLEGTVLRHQVADRSEKATLYRYLLLGTRLNMKKCRVQAEIDGTHLFEEISAKVLQNYLGPSRSKSFVFGTAVPGNFSDKVENLCHELHEGDGFNSLDEAPTLANDDKLDVVAWIPFSDYSAGQAIIFCQCKTGTSWDELIAQLQPTAFIAKWIKGIIVVPPIRAFCICESADRSRWKGMCATAGILIDRCRLVDFCESLPVDLLERIRVWTDTAKAGIHFKID